MVVLVVGIDVAVVSDTVDAVVAIFVVIVIVPFLLEVVNCESRLKMLMLVLVSEIHRLPPLVLHLLSLEAEDLYMIAHPSGTTFSFSAQSSVHLHTTHPTHTVAAATDNG